MTNEEAKDLLDNLIGMVEDNQNNDYDEALKLAIRSLKAWEEVLQEVEQKNGYWAIRLDVLTEFINQKLSEIEE